MSPPASVKDRILRKQGGACAISGQKFRAGDVIEYDHIIPLSANGENREFNLQAVLGDKHQEKTSQEATERAKIDRIRQKHLGIKSRAQGFYRPSGSRFNWQKGRYEC